MELKNKLEALLNNQKEVLNQYEGLINEINLDNSINENIKIKKELEEYKEKASKLNEKLNELNRENTNLKMSLREQMVNERTNILNGSKRKKEIYFNSQLKEKNNKLDELEKFIKNKINKLITIADIKLIEDKTEFVVQIEKFKMDLSERISSRKIKLENEKDKLMDEINEKYNELNEENIDEEVLKKKQKHNNIEVKIGLNLINKIGIILLLFGVATAMKYTYSTWFNDYMKGISGFLFGGILLGFGEWFNKKEKNLFALGLSGGGIGVLYFTVFSSYFILEILSMPISILISVLITIVSLLLTTRYKSMTICGISLIGGYLPFFSYVFYEGLSGSQIYIAMGYLFVLNLLVLGISLKERWIYINYLSFIMNIPCLIYLSFQSQSELIGVAYGIINFIMYLLITLSYPIRKKVNLRLIDIILVGLNTVVNSTIVFLLFEKAGYYDYKGILALIYALIYLGLGIYIQKSLSQEKRIQALFYITSLTFSILMIPFQFGIKWASLGWLIEAILLLNYGVKKKEKNIEYGGWAIFILCLVTFYISDLSNLWIIKYYRLRYTFITLGTIYVLSLYVKSLHDSELFKLSLKGRIITLYKYFTIIASFIFVVRITDNLYREYISNYIALDYIDFYNMISIVISTIVFTYILSKIKIIKDKVVNIIVIVLYLLVDISGILLNTIEVGVGQDVKLKTISIIILVIYNIFIFLNIKELIIKLINKRGFSIEYYPFLLSLYLLLTPIIFIINQFNLENINLIISIFMIMMSFIYIAYGFKKKYMMIRRFGLVLSIFSIGKLVIFDLAFLDISGKIIAYFCFGVILLGISFIYQKLSNSLQEEK